MKTTNLKKRLDTFTKKWQEEPFHYEKEKLENGIERLEVRTEISSNDEIVGKYFYKLVESMGYTMEYYGQCIYHIYQEEN